MRLIELSPSRGREIRKTPPGVVVSPDELNAHMGTHIVAVRQAAPDPRPRGGKRECSTHGSGG